MFRHNTSSDLPGAEESAPKRQRLDSLNTVGPSFRPSFGSSSLSGANNRRAFGWGNGEMVAVRSETRPTPPESDRVPTAANSIMPSIGTHSSTIHADLETRVPAQEIDKASGMLQYSTHESANGVQAASKTSAGMFSRMLASSQPMAPASAMTDTSLPVKTADNARADAVIDLTQDDDDADLVVTGTRKVPEVQRTSTVLFGTVKSGIVNCHHFPVFQKGRERYPMRLRVVSSQMNCLTINTYDARGILFGYFEVRTAQVVAQLLSFQAFRLEFFLYPPTGTEIPGSAVSKPLPFFYNIYGPENESKRLAGFLSQKFVRIEQPHEGYHEACRYVNPLYIQPSALQARSGAPSAHSSLPNFNYSLVSRTSNEVRADVNKLFDRLDTAESLPEMDADPRITTELLKHQKQGVYFLTSQEKERTYDENKENKSLWRKKESPDGLICYYHVITGEETRRRPPDVRGGILADMMGLGKTLQILSLVVSSQAESLEFADQPVPEGNVRDTEPNPPVINAKTTLLICPLSTISNWEEQIQAHVKEGTLKYYLYHGNRRETDARVIAGYDIVITTYGHIGGEYTKHMKDKATYTSPLQQINFFRIVLDEAHMIREQATLQSRAVIALHAQRRWAVTGTPVQNRLDDLAALIKFLRVHPFDDKSYFNQYISAPLKSADDNSFFALRLLVDNITLRRQKDRINLPPRIDQLVTLEFSPAEQELHDATSRQSSKRVDMVAKQGHMGHKTYIHILQMILRLRLICAHGRDLLGEEDTIDLAGLTSSDAINLDDEDTDTTMNFSAKTAYQLFSLMKETGEDVCQLCTKKAVYRDYLSIDDKDEKRKLKDEPGEEKKTTAPIGYLTPCPHMLCKDCVPTFKSRISADFTAGARATCPICGFHTKLDIFELRMQDLNDFLNGSSKSTKKKEIKYRGPSTKVRALISALLENREQGTPEDPIKSVVFSGWTSHMDLIGYALTEAGIRWVRLDGSQSRQNRNAAIADFRDNLEVEVIMVSLMAGGMGLNLTAACRVYVMEPQWNPAAEAQAIDRIHRLGQKKPVVCVRYIMKGSFEQKILEIQKKKTDLANMTMPQGKKLSRDEVSKQRMEHMKDLFN